MKINGVPSRFPLEDRNTTIQMTIQEMIDASTDKDGVGLKIELTTEEEFLLNTFFAVLETNLIMGIMQLINAVVEQSGKTVKVRGCIYEKGVLTTLSTSDLPVFQGS